MDYKEKIKKLLKLAESSKEHEAKAALCKARQIMQLPQAVKDADE